MENDVIIQIFKQQRCGWCTNDPIYQNYHDNEWGKPLHDDQKLFEMLILEGMQAGLSWITILKKREAFRQAFDDFDVQKVMQYDEDKIEQLMQNQKIIRNRRKITAAITNAAAFSTIQQQYGSFDAYLWGYVNHEPIINHPQTIAEVPITTPLSDQLSKDLRLRGFKFVGSTIIYSYLQAVGVVNDHTCDCFLGSAKKLLDS